MIELLLSDSRAMLQDILAWTVCIAAFVWGAGPERAVALVWLAFFELVPGAYEWATGANLNVEDVDPFYAIVDLLALACWTGIALYANRNFTLWIAAMQLLALTAHVARGLVEAISPVAYVTMVAVPGWLQLLLLAIGLGRHIVRRRKFGPYRDWRFSRPVSAMTANSQSIPSDLDLGKAPQPTWRDDLK